ncbi:hypothetical protein [Pseudonocardia yuanmonensis]|uniref:hypothetical protein n=1 Tax=Pseudonocardia yuanmonensis TaxID=1095914 RepID=UPI0031EE9E80
MVDVEPEPDLAARGRRSRSRRLCHLLSGPLPDAGHRNEPTGVEDVGDSPQPGLLDRTPPHPATGALAQHRQRHPPQSRLNLAIRQRLELVSRPNSQILGTSEQACRSPGEISRDSDRVTDLGGHQYSVLHPNSACHAHPEATGSSGLMIAQRREKQSLADPRHRDRRGRSA